MYPIALTGPVQAIAEFERLGLVNKSLIDAVAVDVPLITLANNNIERKERAFRQAVVLLLGFLIAPLHSKLLSAHFSKQLGFLKPAINQALFRTSFKDLHSVDALKKGVERVFEKELNGQLPTELVGKVDESFRKKLLAAKSKFLMADLAVLCALFSSIGFLKVFVGNKMSGKQQFTGELGVVEQHKLDQIYKKEHANEKGGYKKELVTLGLGALVPIGLGGLIWKQHLKPGGSGVVRKVAPFFDYQFAQIPKFLKKWPMMSNAGLILSALVLTMGELMSARSKREFKSLAIQRNSIDFMFFLGTPLFMMLFNKGANSIQQALEKTAKITKDPVLLKKAATRSAWMFVLSFALNIASIAGIIALTNRMTKTGVKDAAKSLEEKSGTNNVITPIRQLPNQFQNGLASGTTQIRQPQRLLNT
ncbi:MAG: hypothetical protein VKJ04_05175 [Vampirovibrionales bacterium]|nr:hypothetical protein [Vampirovibrionales bacterium]